MIAFFPFPPPHRFAILVCVGLLAFLAVRTVRQSRRQGWPTPAGLARGVACLVAVTLLGLGFPGSFAGNLTLGLAAGLFAGALVEWLGPTGLPGKARAKPEPHPLRDPEFDA